MPDRIPMMDELDEADEEEDDDGWRERTLAPPLAEPESLGAPAVALGQHGGGLHSVKEEEEEEDDEKEEEEEEEKDESEKEKEEKVGGVQESRLITRDGWLRVRMLFGILPFRLRVPKVPFCSGTEVL